MSTVANYSTPLAEEGGPRGPNTPGFGDEKREDSFLPVAALTTLEARL
jgi:hypothetical protein